jgi:hypothetical protein
LPPGLMLQALVSEESSEQQQQQQSTALAPAPRMLLLAALFRYECLEHQPGRQPF